MRPCTFQSRNVARCVPTSTRLCTCIKSIRFVCSRASERSIDSMPDCFPVVQTLVAKKSESRSASLVARSPITSSARPYMGDESITCPPSFTKSENTSSSGLRSTSDDPTSKTCQVPRPSTGIFSPDEGIGRISIANLDSLFSCARDAFTGKSKLVAVAANKRATSRRVKACSSPFTCFVMSSWVACRAVTLCEGRETSLIIFQLRVRDSSTSLGMTEF